MIDDERLRAFLKARIDEVAPCYDTALRWQQVENAIAPSATAPQVRRAFSPVSEGLRRSPAIAVAIAVSLAVLSVPVVRAFDGGHGPAPAGQNKIGRAAVRPPVLPARVAEKLAVKIGDLAPGIGLPSSGSAEVVATTARALVGLTYPTSQGGPNPSKVYAVQLVGRHGKAFVLSFDANPSLVYTSLSEAGEPLDLASLGQVAILQYPHGRVVGVLRSVAPKSLPQYPSEGIALTAIPSSYVPPISAAAVVASFQRTALGQAMASSQVLKAPPAVTLASVTEAHPTTPGPKVRVAYPAFVLTFQGTRATSYGPAPISTAFRCTSVAIYDLALRKWTDDFQSCK
ncbi:MAG: hypothetical protein ACYDGN_16460 [Acidimicrobiales bacterium]